MSSAHARTASGRASPRRVRGAALIGAGLLLAACAGTAPSLPEPGARGLVVVRLWDAKGGAPAMLQSRRVRQVGTSFDRLELEPVVMRLPASDGVVYIAADSGIYSERDEATITLSEPVHFTGMWRGLPLAGRADRATIDHRTHVMSLTRVEATYAGLNQTTPWATVLENQAITFGPFDRSAADGHASDPPHSTLAVVAALAALPQPLLLPEFRWTK